MKLAKQWGVFAFAMLLANSVGTAQDNSRETQPVAEGVRPSVDFSPGDVDQVITASAACASGCSDSTACCEPFWKHRHRVFGDYLFLSTTDADVNYALPVDDLGTTGTLTGSAAIVSPDYDSGFRVGGGWAIDDCSSVVVTFWNHQSEESDAQAIDPTSTGTTQFLSPVLIDPATINVTGESSRAEAMYDIDFRMVDLAYERLLSGGRSHAVNAVVGARYGQLDQELIANYSILGGTDVESNIDFDGVGPRLGLDGEFLMGGGFFTYGQGFANFLVGDFRADYQQQNTFAGVQSRTSFEDDRIVSLLELEMGLGWQTQGGRLRLSSGFYLSSWFNAMTMPETIGAVQSRQFRDVSESLTFNGLTSRLELRF